jgi:hypothetical protein
MVNLEVKGAEVPPVEIPGFQLLEPIGEGGAGKVYRALQISLQRMVAVKLLTVQPGRQPGIAFRRESRLMASLAHPNLVTVFDCGQVNQHYYIVTELIQGSTLRPMIRAGRSWPIARACTVLDRIASALTYIHGKGILHLDLKPENILWPEEGEPKITDFGLALAAADAQSSVEIGMVQGTVDYCPPEQRFGLPTSERSDLYSLAVLAYELLTGRLPGRVYQSACRDNARLPAKVDGVLRRGLARSPEERFATVEDFRRDLVGALQDRAALIRRRLALGAALVLCLVTAAFLVGYLWTTHGASRPAITGPVQAWVIHDRPEQLHWFDQEGENEPGGLTPKPLLVQGRSPTGQGAPPLPAWPGTRPALVISSPGVLGFVHPLSDPALGRYSMREWGRWLGSPPTPKQDNFCRAGDFRGDCLTIDDKDESRPWRVIGGSTQKAGNVAVADPQDRAGNPALLMERTDPLSVGRELGCYQWLSRIPERAGTVVVLRYRARAEAGEGRLSVRVELPLLLPAAAQDDAVRRLRGLSEPFADLPHGAGEESRRYKLDDWVTPGRDWQTYYMIWEWPPYCQDPNFRNVVVLYQGIGKVWLDDLEIFTWEMGGRP